MIETIRKNCAECYELTPSFLRPGVFLCHHNPSMTTYCSTLVNPFPTTTAARLGVPLPSPVLMRGSVRVESVETQDWVRGSLRHSMSVQSGIWDKRSALLEAALSQNDTHIIQETNCKTLASSQCFFALAKLSCTDS